MNEQRRKQVLKILELATKINSKSTRRELTGNKPTVCVSFSGISCTLDVCIYVGGWLAGVSSDLVWFFFLDKELDEESDEQLDDCLSKLTELYEKSKDEV